MTNNLMVYAALASLTINKSELLQKIFDNPTDYGGDGLHQLIDEEEFTALARDGRSYRMIDNNGEIRLLDMADVETMIEPNEPFFEWISECDTNNQEWSDPVIFRAMPLVPQPMINWPDDCSKSKCAKHRKEARGW